MTLEKTYTPADLESGIYERELHSGAFEARPAYAGVPFTIIMPPPNVTGSLHLGHALTFTLQDVLARFFRMVGHDVLWQPGTDHAGIATQMVVERQLEASGQTRHSLGREKFLEKVWEWRHTSGDLIVEQQKRLGASADWSRPKFTMDPEISAAVRKVFVTLYQDGLIYKDKRLVNWDPILSTAVSDLEVEQRPTRSKMYYVRFPFAEGGGEIVVATTRPETTFGDVAVAVHPEDARYQKDVGRLLKHPITGHLMPLIADEFSDPEKGSGAVKITPAHDFNDFALGKRHNLTPINIFNMNGTLNQNVPLEYQGLDRFVARSKVVAQLEEDGFLERIEEIDNTVPHGDRTGAVIEPFLTDQWYVNAAVLAGPAIEAVKDGRIQFVPEHWKNTYLEWLNNIEPWCISRQIWWGHQIPAWYGPDGQVFVAETKEEASELAKKHYGKPTELIQDPDVLDTWFSSALWPFTTLGWPESTLELKKYYPSDVMVTGFDIIFFWVARMVMMGLYFMKDVPFRRVLINAIVRDEKGQKMSKSKGNVMDPLVMMGKYGADSVRFALCSLALQGRDVRISETRVEGYRNFTTKLWNACRFLEMQSIPSPLETRFDPRQVQDPIAQWLVVTVNTLCSSVTQSLEKLDVAKAAMALYQGIWHALCDWGVEFSKPCFYGEDSPEKNELKQTWAWALGEVLHLTAPFMPFLSQHLWDNLTQERGGLLSQGRWPKVLQVHFDGSALETVRALVERIRSLRAMLKVSPAQIVSAAFLEGDMPEELRRLLSALAKMRFEDKPGTEGLKVLESGFVLSLDLHFDRVLERSRLMKEYMNKQKELLTIQGRLVNPDFLTRAKEEVVEETSQRLKETQEEIHKLKEILDQL